METIEQENKNFETKKHKKKGLLIAGIILAVLVIALLLAYFLVLSKPQKIFNAAIDKLFKVEIEDYDSVKIGTTLKASIEAEDTQYNEMLSEIENCTLTVGTQMDANDKKEIVDIGLKYNNDAVIDSRIYYKDGDIYGYLDEIFDKYIKIELEDEAKESIDEIFEKINSSETKEKSKVIMQTLQKELKKGINEYGSFDREKATVSIGDKEQRVTKNIMTLTEKNLYKFITSMCTNLADNDDFLESIADENISKKDLKEQLKELANELKENDVEGKNNIKIAIYTKGLLNDLAAVEFSIYIEDDDQTIMAMITKEEKNTYTYKLTMKQDSDKTDLVKGKVEIQKEKDSKKEKLGKAIITAQVEELGKAKIIIDYDVKYDAEIEEVNVKNSINMDELTDEDYMAIMEKLQDRPIIGDIISNMMTISSPNVTSDVKPLDTLQNQVKDAYSGYLVTYSIPANFIYKSDYSYDSVKFYELDEEDTVLEATVSIEWNSEAEYIEDTINWNYDYYNDESSNFYKNAVLGELKTINVGDKEFKYQILSYESNSEYYDEKYQTVYVWYALDEEHVFTVELSSEDKEITEDIITGFLNITVTK